MSGKGKIFKNNPNKPAEAAGEWDDVLDGRPSKTEQKKAVQRMKELAEQLAGLPINQIKKMPLNDATIDALIELDRITSHEARRRHVQLLGKLLRNENESEIIQAVAGKQGIRKNAQVLRWIVRIIEQGDPAINDFVRAFPAAERHTLRQHTLKVQRAKALQAPEPEQAQLAQALQNYVQQVAILSE